MWQISWIVGESVMSSTGSIWSMWPDWLTKLHIRKECAGNNQQICIFSCGHHKHVPLKRDVTSCRTHLISVFSREQCLGASASSYFIFHLCYFYMYLSLAVGTILLSVIFNQFRNRSSLKLCCLCVCFGRRYWRRSNREHFESIWVKGRGPFVANIEVVTNWKLQKEFVCLCSVNNSF